ncbi:hypothetical protein ACQ7A7_21400, partial [Escherichia coli]
PPPPPPPPPPPSNDTTTTEIYTNAESSAASDVYKRQVYDGPVMVVSSQRLHDMLNPTKDTNWNSTYIYKSRHEMLPVNLTPETLFGTKSQDKHALFPIFTASWRANRIKNKGI